MNHNRYKLKFIVFTGVFMNGHELSERRENIVDLILAGIFESSPELALVQK